MVKLSREEEELNMKRGITLNTGMMHSTSILCLGLDLTQNTLAQVVCLSWNEHSHKNTRLGWYYHSQSL